MTKKLICLVLAVLMIVPLLAACGDDGDAVDNITSDASQYTTTLNMWLVTDSHLVAQASQRVREGYVPEDVPADNLPADAELTEKQQVVDTWSSDEQDAFLQVYAVEQAVNKLTKSKFKTQIKLFYVHTDDYYETVEKAFADHQAAIDDGSYQSAGQNTTEETVIIDGIPQLKYPETQNYVVDILYLDGYDRYLSYINNGWLKDMTTLLNTDAVEIGKYVDASFLAAMKYNNFTYAIPNYHEAGQYTYLMVDESLLAEYGRIPSDITTSSIYDGECKTFLDYIYQDKADVTPIYTDSEDGLLDIGSVYYWNHVLNGNFVSIDKDSFSLFGDTYTADEGKGSVLSYNNLLANQEYMDTLAIKRYYESSEGYVTNDPDQRFAAAACLVKGDWELRHEYEAQGYACYVMEAPRLTTEDVFSSMFGIGGKTGYTERAMSIIAYLNTNPEIRNVLQYGVEGENYTLKTIDFEEDGEYKSLDYIVISSENLYEMDVNKTGNAFIAFPAFTEAEVKAMTEEELIEAIRVKTVYQQEKNLEMKTDLTLSMYYNYETVTGSYALDVESVLIVSALSERIEAALMEMNGTDIKNIYNFFRTYKDSAADMAANLLAAFGEDIAYTFNGETKTITVESLTEALDCMADSALVDEDDKANSNDNAKESPNAFYQAWLAALNAAV